MVKTVLLLLMYCYSYFGCDVCGQRACNEDSNVLDSCDGRVISNNNIYVDFGVIKYKCSCSFNFTFNPQLFYLASINPGFDDCGTAIQIKEMNNDIFSIQCMSSVPPTVSSSQFTTVELTCDYPRDYNYCKYTGYCLRVFSNDASIKVHGYCQSIPQPSSSSKTTITTTQSVPKNSTRSVPTHLTQSVTTNSTQRNINQKDNIAITTPKEYLFFLAGAGGIVLVIALAVMMIVKRKSNKKSLSKKKVTDNIYHVRNDERLHGEFKQTSVEKSAVKEDIGGSQYDQSDENRGSGYWMVENSLYLPADSVVTDNEDGRQNDLDINPSVYSEINDSGNNVNHKNTFECHYDYAKVTGSK